MPFIFCDLQVFFWGVRELKRVKYLHVTRPRVDLDCCYKVRAINMRTGKVCENKQQSISSSICKNARINPNFEDAIVVFEVVRVRIHLDFHVAVTL